MPESIEVLQYTDFINDNVKSKLLDIKILKGRYKNKTVFSGYSVLKKLAHQEVLKFVEAKCKGKFMYITFSDVSGEHIFLGVTLGLSGGWFFKPKDRRSPERSSKKFKGFSGSEASKSSKSSNGLKSELLNGLDTGRFEEDVASKYLEAALKHINVEFVFSSGSLYFYDQLSYGTLKVFDEKSLQTKLKTLGVDMSDPKTSYNDFYEALSKNIKNDSKPIGNLIVNQKLISGVGNYLRADSLWAAKISPFRKLKDISESELKKLYKQIRVLIYDGYNRKLGKRLKIISPRDKLPSDYKRGFWIYKMESDIYGHEVLTDTLYEGSQKRFIYYTETQK
jgi:formamidopyrimidine-DNA glycosylase